MTDSNSNDASEDLEKNNIKSTQSAGNESDVVLSRGDRRTAQLLDAADENEGNWAKTLKAAIVNPDFYVYRRRSNISGLPPSVRVRLRTYSASA